MALNINTNLTNNLNYLSYFRMTLVIFLKKFIYFQNCISKIRRKNFLLPP